jgi:hypothetical protein
MDVMPEMNCPLSGAEAGTLATGTASGAVHESINTRAPLAESVLITAVAAFVSHVSLKGRFHVESTEGKGWIT